LRIYEIGSKWTFNDHVSVRMDAIGGFRSGPILKYNSQIVLGLTEIASTGEPCI